MDYGSLTYHLVKVGHIVAVDRLDGRHALSAHGCSSITARPRQGRTQSETFKVMERRLLKAIINPAMAATWVFGLTLAWGGGFFACALAARQARSGHRHVRRCTAIWPAWRRMFASRPQQAVAARFYRILNEVPDGPLILIVFLVVVKPF